MERHANEKPYDAVMSLLESQINDSATSYERLFAIREELVELEIISNQGVERYTDIYYRKLAARLGSEFAQRLKSQADSPDALIQMITQFKQAVGINFYFACAGSSETGLLLERAISVDCRRIVEASIIELHHLLGETCEPFLNYEFEGSRAA